jgi:hypothetical protein
MITKIVGIKIVIQIQFTTAPRPRASEKIPVVPMTHGNEVTEAQITGKNVVVGLSAYFPGTEEVTP